jgi:hypothetical protein
VAVETSSGVTSSNGALGNFIDVFDPARSRADQYLKEWESTGTATVRREPPVSPPPAE